MRRNLRLLRVAWLLNVKQLTRSSFDGFLAILWPLFFATVAFFMFRAGGDPDALVYASLGAAVMGIWTATSISAGSALHRERWHGTLELLVAAPAHFSLVLLPLTFATVGDRHLLHGDDPPVGPVRVRDRRSPSSTRCSWRAAIPATVLSIGALGFLMAVSFARYRTAVGARLADRVPGLADLRLPGPADAAPGLGAPDLVGARADLGHERDPRVARPAARRCRTSAVRPARRHLHRDRRLRHRGRPARSPPQRQPLADMTVSLRIFFIGGLTAYRALFNWLSPWIFVPTLVIAPIFQILLFVYIGRSAGVQSDEFYVIGNAVQYASIPCLFAMTNAIAGERYQQTLTYILVTPAGRMPLFLGRALPVIANALSSRRSRYWSPA